VEKGQKTGEKWCGNRGFFCGYMWINMFSSRRLTGVCCEQSFPQVFHKLSTGFCTRILIIKKSCIGISKTLNLFYFPIRLFSSVFCLLVYSFTCLLVHLSTRLLVHSSTHPPNLLHYYCQAGGV
jgi:hypothetical protein